MSRGPKRITKSTVLKMTGFDEQQLDKLIAEGTFPAPVHMGKQTRWLTMDVLDWLVDVAISANNLRKRMNDTK